MVRPQLHCEPPERSNEAACRGPPNLGRVHRVYCILGRRGGPHFCLGSFLAHLEIRILLEEILARKVRFELTDEPVRLSSNFINGFKSLPVRVVPAR